MLLALPLLQCLREVEFCPLWEICTAVKGDMWGEAVDERMWVQVTAHYVAMTPNGRVFDSSLDRGFPYDIRVGSGQVTAMRLQIPCIFDSVSTTWCLKRALQQEASNCHTFLGHAVMQ